MSAATQPHEAAHASFDGVTETEVREQLERILRADAFQRSKRLQCFLGYITDQRLQGEESKINEYLLGVDVFERGPHYNPAEDSVVRRQAHALRQKLDEYYRTEGAADPIRIEVPLGHYIPAFSKVVSSTPSEEHSARRESQISASRGWLPSSKAVAAVAVVAAGLAFWIGRVSAPAGSASVALASRSASATPISPAIMELWAPWVGASQGPLISFSSPLTAVAKLYETPLPAGSTPHRYPIPAALDSGFRAAFGLSDEGLLYITPGTGEIKSGEARGAVRLAGLFGRSGLETRTSRTEALSWEDFRHNNIVLLGHNEQNKWVDPLLEDYPLKLRPTEGGRQRQILNADPMPGEPQLFEIKYPFESSDPTVEYALVSMIRGPDGLHELLLVSGLNTQATLMGIEFLTNEERVEGLLAQLQSNRPEHSGPWRFQLVLRADVRDKTPTRGAIELIRVIE